MDFKKLKRNAMITIGLTWYNFVSEKPDISTIMNGLGDNKYIPVASPPVIPSFKDIDTNDVLRSKYFGELAKQERLFRRELSAVDLPNSYALGATVPEIRYSPGARISIKTLDPEQLRNELQHPNFGCGVLFNPRFGTKKHVESGYVGLRHTFDDKPKSTNGAA
jgi:hypothetical protein